MIGETPRLFLYGKEKLPQKVGQLLTLLAASARFGWLLPRSAQSSAALTWSSMRLTETSPPPDRYHTSGSR